MGCVVMQGDGNLRHGDDSRGSLRPRGPRFVKGQSAILETGLGLEGIVLSVVCLGVYCCSVNVAKVDRNLKIPGC